MPADHTSAQPRWARDFEQGPIRPPNEAQSLLVRVTRNCPWNRCAFCPVYKGTRFRLRSVAEVEADIDTMAALAAHLEERIAAYGGLSDLLLQQALGGRAGAGAVQVARFVLDGGRTAFLQDANSLIMPTHQLEHVLLRLRERFPAIVRVTTYARSHTVTKRTVEQLASLRRAGLDRIHIGLESGSDEVLALVDKGATAAQHIEAGRRVKAAGLELSEYIMPGLGGRRLSAIHADETARVLREIDPHFIRLRSLAIAGGTPLAALCERGEIEPLGDVGVARELRRLLTGLTGIHSQVRSDHILNLLEEISGTLPGDLPRLSAIVDRFLDLPPDDRDLYIVGRRLGLMRQLDDLLQEDLRAPAQQALAQLRRHTDRPIEEVVQQVMRRFV